MVKPLLFKGDRKPKKRKHTELDHANTPANANSLPKLADSDVAATIAATSVRNNNNVHSNTAIDDDNDTWVNADITSDIAGPVLLVLPTEPPAALVSDTNGSVFASQLENMVDEDVRTVEPHEVRQVWVATRIAGTETWNLKGHHGKYLSADKVGLLSARREAISPEESFTFIPAPDDPGGFGLQTARDLFLAAESPSKATDQPTRTNISDMILRADAESIHFSSTLRIRMQARFKPRLRANKAEKAREKISRKELEALVGRTLDEEEVRRLKKARREGDFHERLLDAKVKGKHDRFA